MAEQNNGGLVLDLMVSKKVDERGQTFWNTSVSQMKFSVKKERIKAVRKAKRKLNYGILNMDNQLEDIVGSKLESVGPMVDSCLFECIQSKLKISKATGLLIMHW